MPRHFAPLAIVVLILACEGEGEDASDPGGDAVKARAAVKAEPAPEPEPPPEPPAYVLLPWDSKLRVAPEQYAPALTLARAEDTPKSELGRVVEVVGKADEAGQWWTLEPGAALPASVEGLPIEGLEHYSLQLYVPAGTGRPVELAAPEELPPKKVVETEELPAEGELPAGKVAILGTVGGPVEDMIAEDVLAGEAGVLALLTAGPDLVPSQSGEPTPAGLANEWQVDSGAKLYWSSGALAGSVRATHAFHEAGDPKQAGGRELLCFDARIGPPKKAPTQLCFEPEAVHERPVSQGLFGEGDIDPEVWDVLMGSELVGDIDGAFGSGGLGIEGEGLSNTGGLGGIGEGKGGVGGSGYGAGSKAD